MALDRFLPCSRRSVLSEVGCLCTFVDTTRQTPPRSSLPCAWPRPAPPPPPRGRSIGADVGLQRRIGEPLAGVGLQGCKLPCHPGKIAGYVPRYVLRVLGSHSSTSLAPCATT